MRCGASHMFFVTVVLMLADVLSAQAPAPNQPLGEEPKNAYYPAAPLHYVNIGAQLAGDYKFGYDTGMGPMGQSFREEVRSTDGSVKGSYGVIDELGHKRVVHYTSGGSGPISSPGNGFLGSQFSGIPRQPQTVLQQNFDSLRQQLPLFKPSNYLQARVLPDPFSTSNVVPLNNIERRPTAVENIENRLPDPLLSDIVLPLYRTPVPEKPTLLKDPTVKYLQKANGYAQQVPVPQFTPKTSFVEYEQRAAVPSSYPTKPTISVPVQKVERVLSARASGVREARNKSSETILDLRKSEIKRVTKKPSRRFLGIRGKAVVEEQPTTAAYVDYYDTAPAFIDIERLSYNIGSGRNAA